MFASLSPDRVYFINLVNILFSNTCYHLNGLSIALTIATAICPKPSIPESCFGLQLTRVERSMNLQIIYAFLLNPELILPFLTYLKIFCIALPAALPVTRLPTRFAIFLELPLDTAWKSPSKQAIQ